MTTVAIARLLHLLAVSLWIGGALLSILDARRSLALGKPHVEALVGRLRLAGAVLSSAGFVTLATGFWLIVLKGGFKAVSPVVHAGLGLTLLVFALGPFTLAAVGRLGEAAAAENPSGVARFGSRFVRLASLEEALRLVVLILMVAAAAPAGAAPV